jgi:hypothetical protein
MGEISPIPAKGVNPIRFEQFKSDLELLLGLITQEELGEAMHVKRSNMNRYIKGTLKITKGFLKKFYAAWEERITEERDKVKSTNSEYTLQNEKKGPTMSDLLTILLRIETKIDRQAGQPDGKN